MVNRSKSQIVSIIILGPQTWPAPRGITCGESCRVIFDRFGSSHEGLGTYRYSEPVAARTISFRCQDERVVGYDLS